jgi:radical SAM-linked protein
MGTRTGQRALRSLSRTARKSRTFQLRRWDRPHYTVNYGCAVPQQQPEQQAPPVQRLRVRYAKRGRLRFTSHRDFSRAFERAVFRARIPMAYSSGFNPHPRISYAGAAPTGSASEAEYLELALAQVVVPADVHAMLDEALPPGLDVLEVVESPGGSLADLLEGSRWRIDLAAVRDATTDAVARFLAADEALVERMTKKGLREFDARGAVVSLVVLPDAAAGGRTSLDVVLRHGTPAVRPDDVLRGLESVAGLPAGEAPLMTRAAQGPLSDSGEVGDPLTARA